MNNKQSTAGDGFARGRFSHGRAWSLLAAIVIGFCSSPASAQTVTVSGNEVIRPATRELRQLLNRARKALDEQDYPAAVQALEELLTDPTLDDYFLAPPGQPDSQLSVKSLGNQLLGSLPPAARQLYETQVGHEARRQLNEALADRDLAAVAEVARRFIHTKAGNEAAFLLGRLEMEQGRALAAALILQPLTEQDGARDALDPELSVLTAAAWNLARRPDKATETLVALKQRQPRVKVRLQDGETPLFEKAEDALKWLESVAGRGVAPAAAVANQWVTFRGDEARNAATAGGLPLVNSEWFVPTIDYSKIGDRIAQYARTQQDKGESIVPALQPLAISTTSKSTGKKANYVIIRTPDEVIGMQAHDSRRLWVYPWESSAPSSPARIAQSAQQAEMNRENIARQRVWDDNLYNQMSSDGTQLYFIEDLEYMNPATQQLQMRGVWPGMIRNTSAKGTNKLTALNLPRQGTICWSIGGESGGHEPNSAGAFFLGAPIAVADRLYVLAEFTGELRLLCLDPETGSIEWKQQLGSMAEEVLSIKYDFTRRLAAASPSYADGVLVCPTSAGAVVAVDLGTRSLKWHYTYERSDVSTRASRGVILSSPATSQPSSGRWLDSSPIVAEGSVVITPIESQFLHCLDLLTGKPRWAPYRRDDMLFVACVHDGKIVLVGKKLVKAINVADGKDAWNAPIDLAGELPSGRGCYTGKEYFLPTTGQQLLRINLETGKIVARAKTEYSLGNLVQFNGQLISASSDQFSSYFLADYIRQKVEQDLAANPKYIRALARKGELLLTENKTDEALTLLRQAHDLDKTDPRIRGLLGRVMLVLLRGDFAKHRELVDDARGLIEDPAQRRELLRLQAVGLHKAGLVAESLQAFVALADELSVAVTPDDNANSQMEYIDNKWQVRTSRWLHGRLHELYASATEADRAALQTTLTARLDACLKADSLASTRRFVEIYGFHPLADQARLQLIEKLIKEGNLLEAELRAGELTESSHEQYRLAGQAALVEVYDRAQRPYLAAERFAEMKPASGIPTLPIVEELLKKELKRTELTQGNWNDGRVVKSEGSIDSGRARPFMNNFSVTLTEVTGPAPRGMRALYDPSLQAVQVTDSLGRTIAQAPVRRSDGTYRATYSIPYSGLVGRATGHIVVVHTGGEVVAIDALRPTRATSDPILWRGEVVTVDPMSPVRSYPQLRQVTNPITGNRTQAFDSSGQTNYQPGPVTPLGIVYQRSRQLICVDPLTGETLWERSGVDPACDLFGDEEYLFVVPTNSDQATVYSLRDGAQLGTRMVGRSNTRLATSGRNVLTWEQTGNTIRLRLFDAWSEKEELWKVEVPSGTKGQLLDGAEFALLEASGKFQVVSLRTGQPLVTAQLEKENVLSSLHVLRDREQYTVLANTPISDAVPGLTVQPLSSGGMPGQQAHGRVYAIDRATGKQRWQVPAFIGQHGIPWDQPVDSPLMVFIRNRRTQQSTSWAANLLCLDKRTGAIAYEGDIATAQANTCEVQADLEKQAVQITTSVQPGTMRVTLIKLTTDAQPPQAPAQTGNLSSLLAGMPPGTSVDVSDIERQRARLEDPFAPPDVAPNGARGVIVPGNGRLPIQVLPPNAQLPAIQQRIQEMQRRADLQRRALPVPAPAPAPADRPQPVDPFK